jgi:hypothetical protein
LVNGRSVRISVVAVLNYLRARGLRQPFSLLQLFTAMEAVSGVQTKRAIDSAQVIARWPPDGVEAGKDNAGRGVLFIPLRLRHPIGVSVRKVRDE